MSSSGCVRFSRLLLGLTLFTAAPLPFPGGPTRAEAHEVRPGYLELRETAPGVFRILWKKPARGDMVLKIDPVFPDGCAVVGIGSENMRGGAYVARATLECVDGLTGKAVEIAGLEATLTDVLVKVYYANGLELAALVAVHAVPALAQDVTVTRGVRRSTAPWGRA